MSCAPAVDVPSAPPEDCSAPELWPMIREALLDPMSMGEPHEILMRHKEECAVCAALAFNTAFTKLCQVDPAFDRKVGLYLLRHSEDATTT